MPRERKRCFHTNMLELPVGGGRESPSGQLSRLQTRQGGAAEEEITENTQDYNGKGVILKPYYSRHLLRGGASR
jgi:hypothetical protein